MNLLGALLGATRRTAPIDPEVHNKLLQQEVDRMLVDFDSKLEAQLQAKLAALPANSNRAQSEANLRAKKAEGMVKLRAAAEAQVAANRRC
jgi:hypothetical protein